MVELTTPEQPKTSPLPRSRVAAERPAHNQRNVEKEEREGC